MDGERYLLPTTLVEKRGSLPHTKAIAAAAQHMSCQMAATAAAGVVAGIAAVAGGCCCADPAQPQHNSISGTYVIAEDNNLRYTPKLLGEQDAYCMRIIALNPENRQYSRYYGYEQFRTPDIRGLISIGTTEQPQSTADMGSIFS